MARRISCPAAVLTGIVVASLVATALALVSGAVRLLSLTGKIYTPEANRKVRADAEKTNNEGRMPGVASAV